jgi:hypothetical protein
VIEIAYRLTKAKSEHEAVDILRDISPDIYPALMRHIHEHQNLFLPEVHMAADRLSMRRSIRRPKLCSRCQRKRRAKWAKRRNINKGLHLTTAPSTFPQVGLYWSSWLEKIQRANEREDESHAR